MDALVEKIKPLNGVDDWRALPPEWPLYGPDFYPPTFAHYLRRQAVSACDPEWAYIKKVQILHPVFYPFLARCPSCRSKDVHPNGWTSTGHREVHGVSSEEVVIGVQLRCNNCNSARTRSAGEDVEDVLGGRTLDNSKFCFVTTNTEFWDKLAVWEIPRESRILSFCSCTHQKRTLPAETYRVDQWFRSIS